MKTLFGYRRPDGKVGFRNVTLVMPVVACVNHIASLIAKDIPGAIAVHHEVGCAQIGADHRQAFKTLLNTGLNPNVGAILLVGLGCERIDPQELAADLAKSGKPVEFIVTPTARRHPFDREERKEIVSAMVRDLAA